jgi:integrase
MLQIYTGCRPGEAYALRWADLDLAHRTVLFRDT